MPVRPSMTRALLAAALLGLVACMNQSPAEKASEQALLSRLAQNPADLEARFSLANLYFDTARPQLAASAYQEVLKHRPDDPNIRADLGTCYKRLGDLDKARAEYERVLKKHPKHARCTYNLAVVMGLLEKYLRAAELFEKAATLTTDPVTAKQARENAAEKRKEAANKPENKPATPPEKDMTK